MPLFARRDRRRGLGRGLPEERAVQQSAARRKSPRTKRGRRAHFETREIGVLESSVVATGPNNFLAWEINGSHDSLRWDLEHPIACSPASAHPATIRSWLYGISVTEPNHRYGALVAAGAQPAGSIAKSLRISISSRVCARQALEPYNRPSRRLSPGGESRPCVSEPHRRAIPCSSRTRRARLEFDLRTSYSTRRFVQSTQYGVAAGPGPQRRSAPAQLLSNAAKLPRFRSGFWFNPLPAQVWNRQPTGEIPMSNVYGQDSARTSLVRPASSRGPRGGSCFPPWAATNTIVWP